MKLMRLLGNAVKHLQQRVASFRNYVAHSPTWLSAIQGLLLGCLLLLILLSAGCAAQAPVVPKTSQCRVPLQSLQPTASPPVQDAVNRDLLQETQELRSALELCNKDKQAILDYIKRRSK